MRRAAVMSVIGTLCVLLGGCGIYEAPVIPPVALIYTDISAPIDTDLDAQPLGTKVGRASTQQILSIVSWGDASVQAAAKDGKITTIHHADHHFTNYLGIYSKFTLIVTGE